MPTKSSIRAPSPASMPLRKPTTAKTSPARKLKWPPDDTTSSIPRTLTGFGDFVWFSAVAWICTRDLVATKALHEEINSSAMTTRKACARLDEVLAGQRSLACTREEAEKLLEDALSKGITKTTARSPKVGIPPTHWVSCERAHRGPHDTMRDFKSGATYEGVRLGSREILARWQPSASQLMMVLGGSKWSLPAAAYWIHHGTHRGFEATTSLRGLAAALDSLRFELRVGSIACWAAVHDGVPGVPEDQRSRKKRPEKFWEGHGFGDVIDPQFEPASIIAKWKGEFAALVADRPPQGVAAERLRTEFGMRWREARKLAQRLLPDGRKRAGVAQKRAQIGDRLAQKTT